MGVNLLRRSRFARGSLVAILDADKVGFLRSGTSLIQTIGRAARNVNAEVILYADKVTDSMARAIDETQRRRVLPLEYNAKHGITPQSVRSAIGSGIEDEIAARKFAQEAAGQAAESYVTQEYLEELHAEMLATAATLDFERAAELRDRIAKLKGDPIAAPQVKKRAGGGDDSPQRHRVHSGNTKNGRRILQEHAGLVQIPMCSLCGLRAFVVKSTLSRRLLRQARPVRLSTLRRATAPARRRGAVLGKSPAVPGWRRRP